MRKASRSASRSSAAASTTSAFSGWQKPSRPCAGNKGRGRWRLEAKRRSVLSTSSRARLSPQQGFADQRQAVVAEIHVGLVDENGRRTEAAARHHFIGVGLELILDRLIADAG